jgi:pSer/pThr/pTyr-binding forkhead associated (FHA) protein
MVLNHPHISKHHCRVQFTQAGIQVTDLGSTNGTILQGKRLFQYAPTTWSAAAPLLVGPFTIRLGSSSQTGKLKVIDG